MKYSDFKRHYIHLKRRYNSVLRDFNTFQVQSLKAAPKARQAAKFNHIDFDIICNSTHNLVLISFVYENKKYHLKYLKKTNGFLSRYFKSKWESPLKFQRLPKEIQNNIWGVFMETLYPSWLHQMQKVEYHRQKLVKLSVYTQVYKYIQQYRKIQKDFAITLLKHNCIKISDGFQTITTHKLIYKNTISFTSSYPVLNKIKTVEQKMPLSKWLDTYIRYINKNSFELI